MTIIVAASWGDSCVIGCDQAGTDGWGVQGDLGIKLHRAPFGWLGFTGSYRTIQVIERALRQVERVEGDADMADVVETIESAMHDAGWSRSGSDKLPKCDDLALLVATWGGELYTVQTDLAFLKHRNFAAIGSGYMVGLGALHRAHSSEQDPMQAVRGALDAACAIIATCRYPAAPIIVK